MSAPPTGGLLTSLRNLIATGVGLLQTRLELLSVELQEEKVRLGSLLGYAVGAFFFLGFGLVFLAVLITVLLWDSQRVLALTAFTAFFLGVGAVLALLAVRTARAESRLFAASLAELAQDRDALAGSGESSAHRTGS